MAKRKIATPRFHIETQPIGLPQLASIVSCVGQDPHLEHGDLLHLFVRLGEAAIFQVEITALFDEALQFDSSPSISVLLPHRSESLVDGFAVFPHPLFLRPWLNHTCCEQRKDQGELLFALGLPTQDAPCLLRFAAPLPISMRIA